MPAQSKVWTIYFLIDPRDGEIRYVGCSANLRARYNHHLADGRLTRRSTRKIRWIKELLRLGLQPQMVSFRRTKKRFGRRWIEETWIRRLGLAGCDLLTDGNREKMLADGIIRPSEQRIKGKIEAYRGAIHSCRLVKKHL